MYNNIMSEYTKEYKLKFANGNHPHTAEEKQAIISNAAKAYEAYLDALGFDWRNDPNSTNTPLRVAKAFVNDLAADCKKYLQPEWEKSDAMTPLVIEYIKQNPSWELSAQLHKYIQVP